jgi:RES domain-containing protein
VRLYRFGSNSTRPAAQEFNGQGGVLAAGRWHIKGTPVVYASTSEPLALLEKLVHRRLSSVTAVYPLYIADMPDRLIEELPATSLPPDWRSISPSPTTQRLGNTWLMSRSAVGLLVPSILTTGADPVVKNCLVDPEHPDFSQVTLSGPILLALDSRFSP